MKKISIILCAISIFSLMACGKKTTTTNVATTQSFINPGDGLGGGKDSEYQTTMVSLSEKETAINSITNNLTIDSTTSYETITTISSSTTICEPGDYLVNGTIEGKIEVTCENVHLFLNNATIVNSKKVIEASEDLIITLIGTNSLSNTNTADTKNVISASKNLIINGTGTLNITSVKNGIKAGNNLYVKDATININSTNHGLSAESIYLNNTTMNITASGDGIHSEIDYDDVTEAPTFTNQKGFVYLKNTNITINSVDDGIQADSFIMINEGTLNITTNNGAPDKITSTTSDNGSGKGLKAGQIDYLINEVEYELESENYGILLYNTTLTVNANDDAIHSNGFVLINAGTYQISAGDDGIHGETIAEIDNGTINVIKSYEALESAKIQILGGNIELNAVDDGINAADGSSTYVGYVNTNCYIIIAGGNTHVNASGDGVDSNGTILMTNGTLTVDGPTSNADGSLDSEGGFLIKGGTLVACGSLGMVETPASNSTQNVVSFASQSSITANTILSIVNDNDETIVTYTTSKQCSSIIISSPLLETGKTYSIYGGSTLLETFTVSGIITTVGTSNISSNPNGNPPRR